MRAVVFSRPTSALTPDDIDQSFGERATSLNISPEPLRAHEEMSATGSNALLTKNAAKKARKKKGKLAKAECTAIDDAMSEAMHKLDFKLDQLNTRMDKLSAEMDQCFRGGFHVDEVLRQPLHRRVLLKDARLRLARDYNVGTDRVPPEAVIEHVLDDLKQKHPRFILDRDDFSMIYDRGEDERDTEGDNVSHEATILELPVVVCAPIPSDAQLDSLYRIYLFTHRMEL